MYSLPLAIAEKPIKLVSWDIDGTLYATGKMKRRLARMFIKEVIHGRGITACREFAVMHAYQKKVETARAQKRNLNGILKAADQQSYHHTAQRWYGPAIQCTGLRAGVSEWLAFFSSQGIVQVVLSDYQAKYKVQALGIADWFAAIYAGEQIGFVKPSPKGFEHIAADFGISPDNILHIGDRAETDGAGAQAAGCQCLILGRDFPDFDTLLKNCQQMIPMCAGKAAKI